MSANEDTQKTYHNVSEPKKGVWRTYDATDGLFGAGVLCLYEDRHGYLWLGTPGAGLYRYDGAEFVTYTTGDDLALSRTKAIYEDSKGLLWFGTNGGGISCFDGERFIKTYTTADGLAANGASAICEDREGRLWVGSGTVLSCFDGERFINVYEGLAGNLIWTICEDSEGRLWVGTNGGGVSCFDGERFIETYTTANGLAANYVRAICEDHEGRLWFGTGSMAGAQARGVSQFDGKDFETYTTADGLAGDSVIAIYEDHQNRLWFGTWGSGVSMFDGQAQSGETPHSEEFITFTVEDGLLDNLVVDVLQDREGGVWFAHPSSGLTRCESSTLESLTETSAHEALYRNSEGGVWSDDTAKSPVHLSDGSERQIIGTDISCRLEDSRDSLWVGTLGDGLYCYNSPTTIQYGDAKHYTQEDGLESDWIRTVMETRDGTIWIGTQGVKGSPGCLCRFQRALVSEDGAEEVHGKAFEAIPTSHPIVSRLFEDSRGFLWMGGFGRGGLSCYDGQGFTIYTMAENGLPNDGVNSIVEDDAGNLWIGTGWGLCRFDRENFITYGNKQGLPDFVHQCSAKDSSGQLWFGSFNSGLYRYDGKHFQWLTTADGLPSNSISKLAPQPDGSMIIFTQRGVVRYYPSTTVPPRIEIREVVADKIYENPPELELTTTEADLLTISYCGLSFATRQMLYSYILEGYDEEWKDTWENQVRYENLPVGEYNFKVIAINRDLVTSETPATLRLNVVLDPRDARIDSLQTELRHLQSETGSKYQFENIIGQSTGIRLVRALMEKAIDSPDTTVLVTGETGTGKELVANAIHFNSSRKDGPLRALHWADVSRDLIPSTLFGHKRGAFTSAFEDKKGYFEEAYGGTLMLDEIGDMPKDIQQSFLRVLQERKVVPIGAREPVDVDVRIIAMTNRSLAEEVMADRFRKDLFHRLNEFPIHIPPLRDRLEDMPVLAEHFLQEYLAKNKKNLDGFATDVFEVLKSYTWPGNVRELGHAVSRAVVLADEGKQIQIHHFSSDITQRGSLIQESITEEMGLSAILKRVQRRVIEDALRECNGNRAQVARILDIHRPNLIRLIKHLGIE